ncbi:hypothetical protein BMS3Bbin06_00469 [bacterium BMS3Bbin06]|nr:hypothetical protein BMS3Abin08_02139 [bacterium BMS3Abin08]GBE33953.1 hypothetical protein BMS3Bbin06_00469 [bacterium BMS3Bbin06]
MNDLIGKEVLVYANGITYSGKLVEVNEREVCLSSDGGWIIILTENVVGIEEKE